MTMDKPSKNGKKNDVGNIIDFWSKKELKKSEKELQNEAKQGLVGI